MGMFDVRCVVTGLSIARGEAGFFLVMRGHDGRAHAVSLPLLGTYDSYGRVEPAAKDPVSELFATRAVSLLALSPKPKRGLAGLVARLAALDEDGATLDGSPVGIAYVHGPTYAALVAAGARDASISMKMRGPGKTVDGLFDVAFTRADVARLFYEGVTEKVEKPLRLALTAFARSGLGHRALTPATEADRAQHEPEERAAWLAEARAAFADVPELGAVFDAYARDLAREDADDEEGDSAASGSNDTERFAPALRRRLTERASALGFTQTSDGSLARTDASGERVSIGVDERTEVVEVIVTLQRPNGTSARTTLGRYSADVDSGRAPSEAADAVEGIARELEGALEKRRIVAGAEAPIERVVALVAESHWLMREIAESPHVAPELLVALADHMRRFPFSDHVREAWIAMLRRPDCPLAIADLLEGTKSASIKAAIAERRARGGP